MQKNIKLGLMITGGAIIAYLIYNIFNKEKEVEEVAAESTLTEAEKQDLFMKTLGYRGGAAPPQELLNSLNKAADEAKAKIKMMGLDSEYKSWLDLQNTSPMYGSPLNF